MIRCTERVIKGYLESPLWNSMDRAMESAGGRVCNVFRIRHLESDVAEELPASEVKAIFFVNDLNGEPEYNAFRFHAQEPIVPGIWVQVQFHDGEVMEGIVENSIRFLTDPGFFLRPTDQEVNNKLVYVMKDSLVQYHVLGLKHL